MEKASNHRRDGSLTSYGSVYSVDIDLSIDESIGPETETRISRPRRQRLGAEMAIIASSSPEIKALNLSDRSVFAQIMESYRDYNDQNGTCSSCSSVSSTGSRKAGALSSLLAFMDDVECSPECRGRTDQQSVRIFMGEADELVRSFKATSLKDPSRKNQKQDDKKHVWFDDKENIHPNLIGKKGGSKKKFGFQSINEHYKSLLDGQTSSIKKPSLHRRASLENLPSPAEIGGLPKAVRPTTSDAIPYFPSEMFQPDLYQPQNKRNMDRTPWNMSLTADFR